MKKYVVNEKTLEKSFAIMKDFVPITDDKMAKYLLQGYSTRIAGVIKDAEIYIGTVADDEILEVVKMDDAQAGVVVSPYISAGYAYSPLMKPVISTGYNSVRIGKRYPDQEIARRVLTGEIDSQYTWIYEELSVTGRADRLAKKNVDSIAKQKGFSVRWLYMDTLMTADLRFDRINIHMDNKDYIERVDIG